MNDTNSGNLQAFCGVDVDDDPPCACGRVSKYDTTTGPKCERCAYPTTRPTDGAAATSES